MSMKINYKELSIYIFLPLILGCVVGLITMKSSADYDGIVPVWVFPVVWSILYILMGISSYLVRNNFTLIKIYIINLIVNFLWPIIFFSFKLKVLGFFWILLLVLIVGYMIYMFYEENKISAYLLVPYLLWIIFASILNLMEIL